MNLVPRRCTNFSGPLWGTNLIVFLFSIIPSKRLFNFNLQAIFCHFFLPAKFFIPRGGISFRYPIWCTNLISFSFIISPRELFFFGFQFKANICSFLYPIFFLIDEWMGDGLVGDGPEKIMFLGDIYKTTQYFFLIVSSPLRRLLRHIFLKAKQK